MTALKKICLSLLAGLLILPAAQTRAISKTGVLLGATGVGLGAAGVTYLLSKTKAGRRALANDDQRSAAIMTAGGLAGLISWLLLHARYKVTGWPYDMSKRSWQSARASVDAVARDQFATAQPANAADLYPHSQCPLAVAFDDLGRRRIGLQSDIAALERIAATDYEFAANARQKLPEARGLLQQTDGMLATVSADHNFWQQQAVHNQLKLIEAEQQRARAAQAQAQAERERALAEYEKAEQMRRQEDRRRVEDCVGAAYAVRNLFFGNSCPRCNSSCSNVHHCGCHCHYRR